MMARPEDGTSATARRVRSHLTRPSGTLRVGLAVGLVAIVIAGASLGVGCGGAEKSSGVAQSTLPEGVHSETLDHESCNDAGHRVDSLDTNGDGKPDIKRLYDSKTGREVCRITDLDHDGKPDLWEYYDANGTIRRREAGYDGTGVVDVIEIFENGKLAERELDTTGQHRVDTWDYFDTASGKITRRERDSTNDGRIDQWWTYDGDKVTIAMDKNGDGKPDPSDTVTIGGSDEPPKPSASPVADAAPPAPSVYVPAGMDAGDLGPPHAAATSSATASADADAGPAAKGTDAKGAKSGAKGSKK